MSPVSSRNLQLLALVCTVIFSLTDIASPYVLRGEVDGNVTFQCPVDNHKTITFFYFQRDDKFLNGFHPKGIKLQKAENTRLDHNRTNVHMSGLNILHNGKYKCIIQYNTGEIITDFIELIVKASYSKPTVTQSCNEVCCMVTCASYGGYPGTEVVWKTPESSNSRLWNIENNTQVPSPSTELVNSTSTAYFNCSNGEIANLSCSVGEVTSNWFSVCTPKVRSISRWDIIITVVSVVLIFLLLVGALCYGRKKRETGIQIEMETLRS